MTRQMTAKLLDDGDTQLVLLPEEFNFASDCDEVLLHRQGECVMLTPKLKYKKSR